MKQPTVQLNVTATGHILNCEIFFAALTCLPVLSRYLTLNIFRTFQTFPIFLYCLSIKMFLFFFFKLFILLPVCKDTNSTQDKKESKY